MGRPFFAAFNPDATWLNHLRPAFGEEKFFFEDELAEMTGGASIPSSPWRTVDGGGGLAAGP